MHEASLHEENAFVTLTYAPENLPKPPSIDDRPLQLFFKRLRRRIAPVRISYFACGEYGDLLSRPHYHALIFGWRPPDLRALSRKGDIQLFRSELLDRLWQNGFTSVGAVTFESAAYVARYALKKITGDKAEVHYRWVDPDTGEVHQLKPEFIRCSLRPAIGKGWFDAFAAEVLQSDSVVARGREMKPPRYYDKLVEMTSPLYAEEIKSVRRGKADERFDEGGTKRLAAREKVKLAQVSQLKRELK